MDMSISKEMVQIAYNALDEKMAIDINIIDISEITSICDFFVVASGRNEHQVQAMADEVEMKLGQAGYTECRTEGYQAARWILMDYNDIVVHIFNEEDREFYNLERLWRDGKFLDVEDMKKLAEEK